MKLLIFGSTGLTGRELVTQALDAGHDVTAFARDPAKMQIEHDRLNIVKGNISDPASIERAIPGHDVVLSTLGSPGLGKSNMLSEGTRHIIAAMVSAGVKRLIFESSIGIGDSRDHASVFARWIFFPIFLKNIFADKEIQEEIIMESSVDWIIVRPGRLTNGPRTGNYREGDEINAVAVGGSISRADTAEFMLLQLTDDRYLHQTPAVSY
ncbi:SDR family oxidoreductase [soil metagenome]